MCGIFGFAHFRGSADQANDFLSRGAECLSHRGPDSCGWRFFEHDGVGLAHRRLSILDVSDRGQQPMVSASGRFWISYNGEVYNFQSLRKVLEGHGFTFLTECDTEVMLAAFEHWGVESAVKRFRGMFAFAVFDSVEKALYLVRDRMGIKPLYYGFHEGCLWFASELNALLNSGAIPFELENNALESYLSFGFVMGECSMVRAVNRLTPGHFLRVSTVTSDSVHEREYWNASNSWIESSLSDSGGISDDEWASIVREKLLEAVEMRMVADVPLGAFLSGGIDSSLIVALMQKLSGRPVKTFTIRTEEAGYDESIHAAEVARRLGTEHHCFTITHQKVMDAIERAGVMFDEPMADVSIIPSLLVSEEARKHVTVALTGDGGDEVFGGYNRYIQTPRILKRVDWAPIVVRRAFAKILAMPALERAAEALGGRKGVIAGAEKLGKISRLMGARSSEEVYFQLITRNPSFASTSVLQRLVHHLSSIEQDPKHSLARKLMRYDISCYLRYDILPKLDVASMQPSLEARVPFLDHELYAVSRQMPDHLMVQNGKGKVMLRRLLSEFLDTSVFERPKMGFGIPVAHWLRTDLKDWAEARIFDTGNPSVLDRKQLEVLWSKHLASRTKEDSEIWPLLLFFSWHESHRR